jgi:predicted  nucleic acid-binding Zn-ribbon protein
MSVAERLRDAIHRDQITTCESCQRILIFPLSDSLLS